jgi:GNAT superfamily N-acetyltransferase
MSIELTPFDLVNAAADEYAALHTFTTRMRAEMSPDDPPTPLAEAIAAWRVLPSVGGAQTWVARAPGRPEVLGRGLLMWPRDGGNRHLAQGSLQVLPEARRRGIARRLLAPMVEALCHAERTLVMTDTLGHVPSGAGFMERLGGHPGLESHTNQLRVDDLNRATLRAWTEAGEASRDAFELVAWAGPYPEAELVAIAELIEVMNTAPTGTLTLEHQTVSGEQLRQFEQALAARATERTTLAVRDRASGRYAGFTEVFWKPSAPELLQQGNTGVREEYRGRKLGRWLKAAMLERLLAAHPEIRFVRTGNADSNAAMLKINQELGFRPYASRTVWQIERAQLERYVGERD